MIQTDQFSFVNQDICDCDQRCQKCGKLKRQNEQPFPQPYPYYPQPLTPYPTQPTNPWSPWFTYITTTTNPCTHQE